MPKFKKGENPVIALTALKKFMQSKLDEMQKTQDPVAKAKIVNEALGVHFEKMGSLTTIYKGGNDAVEQLKVEIRTLYEPIKGQQDEFDKIDILESKATNKASVTEKEKLRGNITNLKSTISTILSELERKIGHSTQHYSTEAITKANDLKAGLTKEWTDYSEKLHSIVDQKNGVFDKKKFQQAIANAGDVFKANCSKIINDAMPTFKKDMELGDYLKNQVRKLVNAVIKLVTHNDTPKFFKTAKAPSAVAVKEAKKQLDPGVDMPESNKPRIK